MVNGKGRIVRKIRHATAHAPSHTETHEGGDAGEVECSYGPEGGVVCVDLPVETDADESVGGGDGDGVGVGGA